MLLSFPICTGYWTILLLPVENFRGDLNTLYNTNHFHHLLPFTIIYSVVNIQTLEKQHCHSSHLFHALHWILTSISTSKLSKTPDTVSWGKRQPRWCNVGNKTALRIGLTAFATICRNLSSVRHLVHFVLQELNMSYAIAESCKLVLFEPDGCTEKERWKEKTAMLLFVNI